MTTEKENQSEPVDVSEAGIFTIVNVAAQRARQLMQGAAPVVRVSSRKPAAIAVKEVKNGLVPFFIVTEPPPGSEGSEEETAAFGEASLTGDGETDAPTDTDAPAQEPVSD